ncbi:MAG: hypothetical protein P0116_13425, partial [Candidatus Nitrosocosmicus sp.]|nr:hypothetical protein [Candidatus Nitrosocosmicus sp.]
NTNNNIGVVQGLDKLSLLNKIKSFSSTNSSVLFLDQNPSQNISSLNYFNNIILEPSFLDLVFPFLPNDYFVSPFEYTYHNDNSLFWSRVNAIDSLHGEFHPYLQPIGIDNWDLDYGKGIVITQASGAKLDIPITVDKDGQYDLFIRYLENFRGGNIKIFLDDDLINEINTQGTDNDDKFVWKKIWSGNLTEGQHKLTIENANGFNAINTFAIVPHDQFKQSMSAIMDKSSGMNLIYLMDQADFDSFGNNTNSILVPLFNTTISNMTTTANKINNTAAGTVVFNGTLNTPVVANLNSLTLNFENKYKPLSSENDHNDNQTNNPIRSIDLIPTSQKTVYSEDYENATNPYELFGDELYSVSTESDNPITGNYSLRVNANQSTIDTAETWNVLQSGYIPIDDNSNLKFKSKVKTLDIYALHPKVRFYDSNHTQLAENVIVESMDGSFEKEYNSDIIPPRNTEFIQIAFLFLPNANSKSSFLLDDTEVTEILPNIHMDNLGITDDYFADMHSEVLIQNNTFDNKSTPSLSFSSLVQTRPIPVIDNASYAYNIDVDDENIDSIKSYALFRESNQPGTASFPTNTTTSTDTDTLNQTISAINDTGTGYTLQKNIDIIKNGTYAFDFQFYSNDTGTLEDKPIKLMIDGVERDYQSLSGNDSDSVLNLNSSSYNTFSIVSTAYLQKGTHNIELTVPDSK